MSDATPSRREFAQRLREESLACRLECERFGSSRKVGDEQKRQMAELFDADPDRLAANKKLLNKRHEAYLAVTGCMNRARGCWMDSTVPYPEPGLRLIKRERVESFDQQMRAIKAELIEAKAALERVYHDELIPDARERLGEMFDANDYPVEISSEFDVNWGFSNVDPPEYLRQISPRLYEQEQERVRARFEEAIALTEAALVEEFAKAVQHLVERMTPSPDGKKKIFKDTVVENLHSFFGKFRSLNIGSNEQLDHLVDEAQKIVSGVDVANLRKDVNAQRSIGTAMSDLSQRLDALMVDRPMRRITLGDELVEGNTQQPPPATDAA